MSEPCSQEIVLSQDYTEFLTVALSITPELLNLFRGVCYQQIDPRYFTIYTPVNNVNTISLNQFSYNLFPKLYGEMSTAALEISGITRIASQPVLNLKGQGVLIGIADSGIDFTILLSAMPMDVPVSCGSGIRQIRQVLPRKESPMVQNTQKMTSILHWLPLRLLRL